MAFQTGRNVTVSYAPETVFGTKPAAATSKAFRPNSGGLTLAKEPIRSGEVRRDGMSTRGRHGSRSVAGSYAGELSVGTFDELIEAALRGTFSAALTVAQTNMSSGSITVQANSITASAGSWITAGIRVGDIIRGGTGFVAGNTNRNLRVTGVTATVLTIAETLTVQGTAVTTWTLTRPKKVTQGMVARSFTIDEHEVDIDGSEVFKGCRVGSMQVQLQPNGMAMLTFGFVGQDMEVLTGAAAPYFTAPTEFVSIPLTAVEAKIRLGANDVIDITSIDMTLNLSAAGTPVVGSVLTPEVFTNLAVIEGTITALKQDVSRSQQYLNEEQLSLHLLFEEPGAGLSAFCSFFLANFTLASASKGEIGGDNGRTQSFTLLTGVDERGGAYDRTMIKFQTSAA